MVAHITIGEPACDFVINAGQHEYWVCVDARMSAYSDSEYFVGTVYRDDVPWYETSMADTINDAVTEALAEIVPDAKEQPR